jgi:hypothetical protein
MIGEETFTVSLLKSLTIKSLDKKYQSPINNTNSNILLLFKEHYFQSTLSLIEGILSLNFAEINFTITSDVQQCKLLRFGEQNWQDGKIKIIGVMKMDKESQGRKLTRELTDCFPKKTIIHNQHSGYIGYIEIEVLFCPEDLSNNES